MTSMEEHSDISKEQFILKEVSEIQAIHQLDDLVRQGAIKSEKVVYVKEKYNELRDAYMSMLTVERALESEADEMETQVKDLSTELNKILQDSMEDEETLELVREDVEQAESEAQVCKEKEQTILIEVLDLTRLQELYKEKICEIEREHAIALAPVINQYKLEIDGAKEAVADALVKKEQYIKESKDCKERLQQVLNDIQQIQLEKKAHLANLEGLEGAPDRYHKQADILSTAVKALQLQDQKWIDKVKEVEVEIAGLQGTAKHLSEELSTVVVQIEKVQLSTEQKERQAAEIARDLEAATLEVDDYLADQVNVDMQLRSKSADLRLEQEQLAARTKEKDKALRKLKLADQLVSNMQASFPMLMVECDKVHSQVMVVENERKKVTNMVNELKHEIDIQMHNFLVVEALGKEVSSSLRTTHKQVAKMELDVAACAEIERLKNQHINNLTMTRERMCRQAVQKHHMWKDALKKLHVMDILARNTLKRDIELEQHIKDAVLLYNLVRSQRNKFASLVHASNVTKSEMRDKLTTISIEVEALENDVKYKDKVLAKQRAEYQASVKGRTQLLYELTRSALLLRNTHNQGDEYEVEVAKLEGFVKTLEREMIKTRKLYSLELIDRNQTGIALIDRNDELCILYEKSNVQEEVLKHSEVELHKRLDEIRYLKIQNKHMQQRICAAYRTTPNLAIIYNTLTDLRQQFTKAKSTTSKLSDLVENPDNMSRWKLLPGRDLRDVDLHLKTMAIDEFLSAKSDEALEKELILEEVMKLTNNLKRQATNDGEGRRNHTKQMNRYQRYIHSLMQHILATISELSLCQAIVLSMKEEKEQLHEEVFQAYSLLTIGESPTTTTTGEWQAKQRELALKMKWDVEPADKKFEEEQIVERKKSKFTHGNDCRKSTAEQRPNAYLEEELGLPRPFGFYSPFKPSDTGAQMRHFKFPEPKAVEL